MSEQTRSVLLTLLLVVSTFSTVGVGAASAAEPSTFHVTQGSECYEVTPIGDGSTSVEEFYDYRAGAGTLYGSYGDGSQRIQENQVSHLFVYDGSQGLSLVMLHDDLNQSQAGAITFDVSGLPDSHQWIVEDDDYPNRDDNFDYTSNGASIDWMWADSRTDGAAVRGLSNDFSAITIDPAFGEESWAYQERDPQWGYATDDVSWELQSGDGTEIPLDKSQSLDIARGSCPDTTDPSAALSASPSSASTGETVTFDASGSDDGETSITEYRWDFDGDGQTDRTTSTATVEHAYDSTGTYDAAVTVVDEGGNADTATATVSVEGSITYINGSAVEVEGTFEVVRLDVEYYTSSGYASSTKMVEDVSGTTVIVADDQESVNGTVIKSAAADVDFDDTEVELTKDNPDYESDFEATKPEPITVSVEEVTETGDGTYDVTFGYNNTNDETLGFFDSTLSGNVTGDAPTELAPGENTFTVSWTPDSDDEKATWTLSRNTYGQSELSASTPPASELGDDDTTAPTASISGPDTAYTDTTVSFDGSDSTDNVGIVEYVWEFDGEVTKTGEQVSHLFDTTGQHTVTLTVKDAAGNTDTASVTVEAVEEDVTKPDAELTANRTTAAVGEDIEFDASNSSDASGIESYYWNFDGDSEFEVTTENPTVTRSFSTTGERQVEVMVMDNGTNGLTNVTSVNVTIESGDTTDPVAALTAIPSFGSVEETEFVFRANASEDDREIAAYHWDLDADGDFETMTDDPQVSTTYSEPGAREVAVKVEDAAGNTDTATTEISVYEMTDEPGIEFVNATAVEVTGDFAEVTLTTTYFTESGVQTATHTFEDVSGTTTLTAPDEGVWGPVVKSVAAFQNASDSKATVAAENPDYAAQLSEVRPEKPSTFVESATEVSNGTYEVTFGYVNPNDHAMVAAASAFTSGDASATPPTRFEPGRHTFTVTWTPDSDDANLVWETDFSNFGHGASTATSPMPSEIGSGDAAPTASLAAGPTTVEVGETVAFSAGQSTDDEGIESYRWDFDGDGEVERTTSRSNVTHTYSAAGTYDVSLTVMDTQGQTDTAEETVTVEKASTDPPTSSPTAVLSVDDKLAIGVESKLVASGSTGDGDLTYKWDVVGDDGYEYETDHPYVWVRSWRVYEDTGTYEVSVTVVDENGSTDTATKTVEVVDRYGPTANLVAPDTVTVGEEFDLFAEGAGDPSGLDYVVWKSGGEQVASTQNASHTFHESGTKTITLVMRDLAGHTTTKQTTVQVKPAENDGGSGGSPGDGGSDSGDGSAPDKGTGDENDDGSTGGGIGAADPGGSNQNADERNGNQQTDERVSAPLNGSDGQLGTVTVRASAGGSPWVEATEEMPEGVTAPTVESQGFEALSYLSVSGADRTTVTVSKSRLDEMDATPGDVTLFRHENGTWTAVETTQFGATDDAYRFRANVSDGTYAVGVDRPATSVADLSVESQRVEPGESVTMTVTVENTGRADGSHEVSLSVGGEVVATKTVSVEAGATTEVTFSRIFDSGGVYEVGVGDATAEVVVEGVETTQTTTDDASIETSTGTTTDNSGGIPGFGVGVTLVALLAAALLALRRQ